MKKLKMSLMILLTLISFNLIIAQDMNPDAGKLYNEGNSLLKAGNYKGAIENYDKALAIEKDYRIYYQKGVAQKKARDLKGAMKSFDDCIKMKSDFAGAYNALGGVYFQEGDFNAAITNFEKVLTLTDKSNVESIVKSVTAKVGAPR